MTSASSHLGVGEERVADGGPYDQLLVRILEETLRYARARDYVGPDYCDGMSSRLLQAAPVDNKWINLVVQETVKRAPVDVRPLFLVEERRNFKGTALFSMANLNLARLASDRSSPEGLSRDDRPTREAARLANWLIDNRCEGFHGFCGGHQHEIQLLDGRGVPSDPDVVSTSYAVKALLRAADLDDRYTPTARTAADFVVEDLDYREVDGGAKIDYHLNHPDDYYTLNSGALGARLFIDIYDRFGDERLRERAAAILDYVASEQADIGGWTYRIPADASHLSMDNHHNGFIIEALLRYQEVTGEDRYEETLSAALPFYRETLFDANGAPNWDESRSFPRDVHASAQGILVFSYTGDHEFARRIIDWTLGNLYGGEGQFYHRKNRVYTRRVTLMRWCQAWMAYALSEYLTTLNGRRTTAGTR